MEEIENLYFTGMTMTQLTTQQLFTRFTSVFGHRVIKRRQQEWHKSKEGWDYHALLHMLYWVFHDRHNLAHSECWLLVKDRTLGKMRKRLLELAPELNEKEVDSIDVALQGLDNHSLQNPLTSEKSVEELLAEGYVGVDAELAGNVAFALASEQFKKQINWIKSKFSGREKLALMTSHKEAFEQLLEFLNSKFGWYPEIYQEEGKSEVYIFPPDNHIEEEAIQLATTDEDAWTGSLYSLDYLERHQNVLLFIFATKSKNSDKQEWLVVQKNVENNQKWVSLYSGTLEEAYYNWAKQVDLTAPKFRQIDELD